MIAVGIDWHITESTDIEGICQACFESDPLEEADGDEISWIAGDNCDKLYHVVCLVGYVDKFRKWFCNTCKLDIIFCVLSAYAFVMS